VQVLSQCGAEHAQIKKALDMRIMLESLKNRTDKLNVVKNNGIPVASAATSFTVAERSEASGSEDSDSDDDLVEVPGVKEGLEYPIPAHRRAEYGLCDPPAPAVAVATRKRPRAADEMESSDPTSWLATVKKLKEQLKKIKSSKKSGAESGESVIESSSETASGQLPDEPCSSRKSQLQSQAPVLPFSTDLLHWGEEGVVLPLKTK
jgi:hypothetical protein